MEKNNSKEFEALVNAAEKTNFNRDIFKNDNNGFMLVDKNKILGLNAVPGLEVDAEEIENGIRATITVKRGHKLENPVHICFGVTGEEGVQEIQSEYFMEEGSEAKFISHCSFPKAVKVIHNMQSKVHVGKFAKLYYEEVHFHGDGGGVEIKPVSVGEVDEGGYFESLFKLIKGRVGKIDLDFDFTLGKNAVAEIDSKIYAKEEDYIKLKEKMVLAGERARGTVTARVFASDRSYSEVYTEMYGNAPYVKGHVDCIEVIKGNAEVSAIPIIKVTNDLAELTHEASIGRVNQGELETLMARGLTEDEATDMIVKGMLK